MSTKKNVNSSKIWTVAAILICAILIPILIVNLTIIFKSIANPQQVPSFFGYRPLIVLSGSMEPQILPGDIVVTKDVPADTLKEGDIVSYLQGSAIITHRIVSIDEAAGVKTFQTKGDNNNTVDDTTLSADMLQGKFLYRIPRLGHVAMFLQTPIGMILFIAVPLVLFVLYDILRRSVFEKREAATTSQLKAELEAMRKKLAEAEAAAEKEGDQKA